MTARRVEVIKNRVTIINRTETGFMAIEIAELWVFMIVITFVVVTCR